MKTLFNITLFAILSIGLSTSAFSQDKSNRASPPMSSETTIGEASISVHYSSPAMKGRTIWGDLVPNGKIWRAGANEATTFETNKDIILAGKKLSAGKYSLFLLPSESEWTFVFNTVSDQWGSYQYDEAKDALRVSISPTGADKKAERLSISVDESGLTLHWANKTGTVPIE